MITGNAKLIIDLGNSSTKGMVIYGKNANGKPKSKKFTVPNVFGQVVDPNYSVSNDYSPMSSTIIRVDTELNGTRIVGDYAVGELQEKEFYQATIRPSAKRKKYDNDTTPLSYRMAFYEGARALLDINGVHDLTQVDVDWEVVTLLPPADIDRGADKIKAIITDIKEVTCKYPDVKLDVKVKSVNVLPEGFCAYAGVLYDTGLVFRKDYKFLKDETVLVLDVGAGTTDMLVIKDNKLVQNSRFTVDAGGNNIESKVKLALMQEGYQLDAKAISDGIITGKIKAGSKYIDIIDKVNNAKEVVAGKIIDSVVTYIEGADMMMSSIGYLIICGGGSIDDATDSGIHSLSSLIMNKFKDYVPNAELVTLPEQDTLVTEDDGDVKPVKQTISPRDLNLIGASILAESI